MDSFTDILFSFSDKFTPDNGELKIEHRDATREILGEEFCHFMDQLTERGEQIYSRGSDYYKAEDAFNHLMTKTEILKGLVFGLTGEALEERLSCLKFQLFFSKALPEIYLEVLGDRATDENKEFFTNLIKTDGDNLSTLLLTEITKEYLYLITAGREVVKAIENMNTIVAKQNRAKQNRTDPNKQNAIDEAKRIWGSSPNYSLDEVAERIRRAGITDKSHSTVKQWISKFNPTKRAKK